MKDKNYPKTILLLGKSFLTKDQIKLLKKYPGVNIFISTKISPMVAKEVSIIITSYYLLDKKALLQMPNLKFILACSTGFNYIDIDYAKKSKILVANCPAYATISVAEHALGLIINLLRKTSHANSAIRKKWDPFPFQGQDLYGKTVGIVGYGRIGKRLGEIVAALGANVVWINSKSTRRDFEKLLKVSDIVSLHVPLKVDTTNLIGEKELTLMKKGVYIINTARGPVINERALLKVLIKGEVAGVGLDVFEKEPLPYQHTLKKLPNVILTPHIAAYTEQAMSRISEEAFSSLMKYLEGKHVSNIVK